MTKQLAQMLERVKTWPVYRQAEVVGILEQMEKFATTVYKLSPHEQKLIDEALDQADRGEYVTDAELKKFRNRHKHAAKKA